MPLTQDQLATLRQKLETENDKLRGVLATLDEENPASDTERLNDNADIGTDAREGEELVRNESLRSRTQGMIDRVGSALARMEQGTYGVTEQGNDIPYERLLIDPTVTTTVP